MSDSIDLQQVEQNIRHRVNQDGLTYLFMGLLLAMVGWSLWDGRFAAFGGLAVLLIFPLEWVRKWITYPRIGYVQFKLPEGFGKGILGFMAVVIAVLVGMIFVADGRYQRYIPIIISGIFALSLYFGASMSGIRLRDWVVIVFMVGSSFATVSFFDDWHRATAVQMWITASLLVIMGTVDLIRFLRGNPVIEEPVTKSS